MRHFLLATTAALTLVACQSATTNLTPAELQASAQSLRSTINANSEPVTAPIGVYDAMARALKNNLDHRVAMMELDLARQDYELSRWDQLPKVVASGGYYGRGNEAGASSLSLLSGRESLEPSTSLEEEYAAGDLMASWNILDFGLSRIRSEQLQDESRIMEERRRKAVISIMEDVHRAYWRAVSADRLVRRLDALEGDVRKAFDDSRALYQGGRTAPMPALSFQRELNDIQGQAQRLRREMGEAKAELASLMGMPPDQPFSLSIPTRFPAPMRLNMNMDEMIATALNQRPEMREALYRTRIAEGDIRKATLEAFPSLEGFVGLNASTNDFLFNQDWVSYGAKASWNLMKIFETPKRRRRAMAADIVEHEKALATAMAVMTQVAVSRLRYQALAAEYQTAQAGAGVQGDITALITKQAQVSSASRQTLVREQMNAILAEARRDAVHAHMREAESQIYSAMGFDPYPQGITGQEDLQSLAVALQQLWESRPT
jgi:outer membrane protein TolC